MKRKIALLCAMTLLISLLALPVYADSGRSFPLQTVGGSAHSHSAGLSVASNAAMPKPVIGTIKLQLPGGKATAAPPVGPALKSHGVDVDRFLKEFNKSTKAYNGTVVPVVITVYRDHSFSFTVKTPPTPVYVKIREIIIPGRPGHVAPISPGSIRHIME